MKLKKDKIDFVKQELLKILEPTRKEQGCLKYDLHQDLEDPSIFYVLFGKPNLDGMHKKHILDRKTLEGDILENKLVIWHFEDVKNSSLILHR